MFGERNGASELEAEVSYSGKPKLITTWAEQLNIWKHRTMTFVDRGWNWSWPLIYVSLSRKTGCAILAFEYEINLNAIYKSSDKYPSVNAV
jgi:hypothetical protein